MKSVTAVLVAALLLGLTHAQVTISGPRTIKLEPGESGVYEYQITNHSDEAREAELFILDLAQKPNGDTVNLPPQSIERSLHHIATFRQTEFLLDPRETLRVPVEIALPENGRATYWGVVGIDVPPPETDDPGRVTFRVRYGMVTKVDALGVEQHELNILGLAPSQQDGQDQLKLTLENSGTSYERVRLTLEFHDHSGQRATLSRNLVILPGMIIDYLTPVPGDLDAGTYGVFATLTFGSNQVVEEITTLTIP